MLESEYDHWMGIGHERYIQEKIRTHGYTRDEAEKIAKEDVQRILPDGFQSKDNFFFVIREGEQDHGFLWYCLRGEGRLRHAWLCNIHVNEDARGKGYGKQAMEFFEADVKKREIQKVGLHVFGYNEVAQKLYLSQGYEIKNIVMEKVL